MAALINNGPLSVLIDASGLPPLEFHEYGVYNPWYCDPNALDHAVLLVGYGSDDGNYWIVKNSWFVFFSSFVHILFFFLNEFIGERIGGTTKVSSRFVLLFFDKTKS